MDDPFSLNLSEKDFIEPEILTIEQIADMEKQADESRKRKPEEQLTKENNENNENLEENSVKKIKVAPPIKENEKLHFIPFRMIPRTVEDLAKILIWDKSCFLKKTSPDSSDMYIISINPQALEKYLIEKYDYHKYAPQPYAKVHKLSFTTPWAETPFGWAPYSSDKGNLVSDIRLTIDTINVLEHKEFYEIIEEFKKTYITIYVNEAVKSDFLPLNKDLTEKLLSSNEEDHKEAALMIKRLFQPIIKQPSLEKGEERKPYHDKHYINLKLNAWYNFVSETDTKGNTSKKKKAVLEQNSFKLELFQKDRIPITKKLVYPDDAFSNKLMDTPEGREMLMKKALILPADSLRTVSYLDHVSFMRTSGNTFCIRVEQALKERGNFQFKAEETCANWE